MIDQVLKTAQRIEAMDLQKDSRVAIFSKNRIETFVLTLACWKHGIIVVPMSTRYPEQTLGQVLEDINCKDVIIGDSIKKPEISGLRYHDIEQLCSIGEHQTTSLTFEQLGLDLSQNASILFTSGSGSRPRGVLHTIGNHYYSALGALDHIPFEQTDRWLMSLPMYHISGFSLIMRSLIKGGMIVFPEPGQFVLDSLVSGQITHISLVPAQLSQWLQNPDAVKALRQCKSVLLGGAAASESLIKKALGRDIPLSTTYGSTEAASQVTTSMPQMLTHNPAVSGKVLPYRQLSIGSGGEILLKGETLFKGYVVEDKFDCPFDRQGWFHTGDIGTLDSEGVLTVIGRKDRMFISGGENIYPEEIEKALLLLDTIQDCFVVSVPDAIMGARPVAFIKKTSSDINPEMIRSQLQHHLERFKIPVVFLSWPDVCLKSLKPDTALFQSIALEAIKSDLDL